jgi:hypothetical protein
MAPAAMSLLPLLLFHRQPAIAGSALYYTQCVSGRYGASCDGRCECAEWEDCDEGVRGDGSCTCALGYEHKCGQPSPLVPLPNGGHADGAVGHQWCTSLPSSSSSSSSCSPSLEALRFSGLHHRALSMDSSTRRSPRLTNASAARVLPAPLKARSLAVVAVDPVVAALLGIDSQSESRRPLFAEVFSGRVLLPGADPYAHAYGGHQFGSWAGQLGDGRAISLGELPVVGAAARGGGGAGGGDEEEEQEEEERWEISLKGAGRTAFSRAGDGRAVLRSLWCADTYLHVAALHVPCTHPAFAPFTCR